MWRQRKYLNFLTPNLYAVFNNVYMYMQYIEDNRFTMNIFKRLKIRQYKYSLNRWVSELGSLTSVSDLLLCGFMSFISINQDVFPSPAFEYKDLKTEDYLIVKVRDTEYKDYKLMPWMKDQDIGIIINRRTKSIIVSGLVKESRYKHEFKDKGIYPDNNLNSDIFKMVLSIIEVCTKSYVRGDQDAIEKLFRTKPIQ